MLASQRLLCKEETTKDGPLHAHKISVIYLTGPWTAPTTSHFHQHIIHTDMTTGTWHLIYKDWNILFVFVFLNAGLDLKGIHNEWQLSSFLPKKI